MGNITHWDDDAIKALNPDVAGSLPHIRITMSYLTGSSLGLLSVFKKALSSFSPAFKVALAQANDNFALLAPGATLGTSVGFSNNNARLSYVQV